MAIEQWAKNHDKNGVWMGNVSNSPTFENIKREWWDKPSPLTINHILGSSYWKVSLVEGNKLRLQVFNVTNVGSAIGANYKEIMGIEINMGVNQGYPRPQSTYSVKQPFTNISQMIDFYYVPTN